MSDHQNSIFWIPLLLAVAFLLLGLGIPVLGIELPPYSALAALVVAALLVVWAGVMAYRNSKHNAAPTLSGGIGGSAEVDGNRSTASGGDGGAAGAGIGGAGGSARVNGNNSSARGGRGGNG